MGTGTAHGKRTTQVRVCVLLVVALALVGFLFSSGEPLLHTAPAAVVPPELDIASAAAVERDRL